MADGKQQTPNPEPDEKGKTKSRKWHVRKRDGSTYGPETTEVLLEWAAQCRLVSGNEVSEDGKVWVAAERIPELQMCWTAALPDGRAYGPFNVLATHELHKHNVLPADATLTNTITGETTTVSERVDQELKHKQGDMFGTREPDSPKPKRKRKRSMKSDATGREEPVATEESKETQALQTELESLRAQCKTLEEQGKKHKEALKTRTADHKAALAAIEEERNAIAAELDQLRDGGEVAAVPDGVQEQITALEEQLKAREEGLQAAQAELKARQADSEALEAKLSDTRQELEIALEATEKKLADESDRASKLTEELEETRRELEDVRQAPEGEAGAGGESSEEDKVTIDALGRQIRVLKEDLEKTRLDLDGAREALESKNEEVQGLRVEIRDSDTPADERVEELETKLSAVELDATNREKAFKRERGALRERVTDAEQRLEESREQALQLAERLKKAEASVSSADARQRALRTDLESRYSRTRRDLAGAQMALTETRRKLSFFAIATLVCFALAITFFWLWVGARRDRSLESGPLEGAEPGLEETVDGADRGTPGMPPDSGGSGTSITPPPASSGEKTPAHQRVKVAGVSTRFTGTTCTMVFEQPVFTSMATISTAAKTQLKQIATQVREYMGDFTLTIRGHTDNVPLKGKGLYRDNKELGLARAKSVQAFLVKEGKLPAKALEAITAGADNPPFPNDKAESRRKNRTVVLILVKKK